MTAVPISIRLGLRADSRQQRKRRAELAGEVMHTEVGAVRAELLGRDRQVDGLQERVGRRARLRLRRGRPMAEREEADFFRNVARSCCLRRRYGRFGGGKPLADLVNHFRCANAHPETEAAMKNLAILSFILGVLVTTVPAQAQTSGWDSGSDRRFQWSLF